MRFLFAHYLFACTLMCVTASAEELPTNPWLNPDSVVYVAQPASSDTTHNKQQTSEKQTVININFNILMNFFTTPFQASPNAAYSKSGAIADFLKSINREEKQNETSRQTAQKSNPLNDTVVEYNRYMNEMKQKYYNTKQSIENYYNDKMNALSNMQKNATQSMKKLLK